MASLRHGFEEPGDLLDIRLVVDTIPTLAWSARPDGSAEFFNQRWLDYTGLSAKQAVNWGGRLRFIQTTCHEFWSGAATLPGPVGSPARSSLEWYLSMTSPAPIPAHRSEASRLQGMGANLALSAHGNLPTQK
jgi:PAS domain-containing protein